MRRKMPPALFDFLVIFGFVEAVLLLGLFE